MKPYDFTLLYRLPESDPVPENHIPALEGTCGDALLGVGRKGRISLMFTRDAISLRVAIYTAMEDVEAAIPEAKLIKATQDIALETP